MRSKGAFSLIAGGAYPDYKVRIVEAVLFVRKAVLSSTVAMAYIRALEKGTAKYPLRTVDCKVYSIPQGAMSSTHENLFLGTLPKRGALTTTRSTARSIKTIFTRRTTPLTS